MKNVLDRKTVTAINIHGSQQGAHTGWMRWSGFTLVTFSDGSTRYFPESVCLNEIYSTLEKDGVDCSKYKNRKPAPGYPPKPENVELYQHNYGYEKPVELGDWQWSTTFGRWGRMVKFADGWHGYSWPKT